MVKYYTRDYANLFIPITSSTYNEIIFRFYRSMKITELHSSFQIYICVHIFPK